MGLTRQQIIDYASRYVAIGEVSDFPGEGDLFCMLSRELTGDARTKENEGWQFAGYHVCRQYLLDEQSRAEGKWIWFEFMTLMTFPPHPSTLKLQPPHIVKGQFQNAERTKEFRIIKILPDAVWESGKMQNVNPASAPPDDAELPKNVLRFPSTNPRYSNID